LPTKKLYYSDVIWVSHETGERADETRQISKGLTKLAVKKILKEEHLKKSKHDATLIYVYLYP
jgi:hypothetical protein